MITEPITKQNYGRSKIGKSAKTIIPQHKGIFITIWEPYVNVALLINLTEAKSSPEEGFDKKAKKEG